MKEAIRHETDARISVENYHRPLGSNVIKVTWYTNNVGNFDHFPLHSHPYAELIMAISGCSILYSANGEKVEIEPGEVIYFPPETFHSGKFIKNASVSQRLAVQISNDLWKTVLQTLPDDAAAWSSRIMKVDAANAAEWNLKELFQRMSASSSMTERFRQIAFQAEAAELTACISHISESSGQPHTGTNALVAKATSYLEKNYRDPLCTVQSAADSLYVSREYLSRLFHRYMTESIHEYLSELRMQTFRSLVSSGESIADASAESGFSDYSSFYKTFKKIYHMTPAEYKKGMPAD